MGLGLICPTVCALGEAVKCGCGHRHLAVCSGSIPFPVMAHRFTCTERVQFSDTDMAGIVHFSNFFRYMERVEHAFFRSLGFSIVDPAHMGEERVGWPRVHASCDYFSPLHFEEEFECELLVEEVRSKVVRHLIRFWKADGELAAEGRITASCLRRDPAIVKMTAIEIPHRFRDQIDPAPVESLRPPEPQ